MALVGAEVPAGSNDIALFPEQPRGAFDFFTVFTRSNLAEQTTPAYLSIEDESSYARNISFIDDDLDDGEIGGYLLWRIPEDDSEVTHYLVYLSDDEVGRNRSLLGNVTVKTHEFLVPADTDLSSYRFLTVFARSSLAEQTTPRWVEVVDTVSSVSNIAFIDKDLDWEELGGRVSWSHPPSRSRVEFYELYLASDASGANRLPWHLGSIPFNVSEVLWPPETPKESFTHFVVYTRSWLAEQTTPVAFAFEDKVSLVTDIDFPDFDLDLEDLGGTLTWLPPNDTTQVTHYMIYLAQANTSQGCSNTSYLEKQNESNVSVEFSDWCLLSHLGNTSVGAHSLFIPPDTSVPPFSHLAIYTLSSLVEQTTPMALRFFDEVASVSEIRFTDEDLDPIDLGGWIHWTPPLALRRVAWYVVDLAVDAAGPLEAQQRSQIESSVAVGTNQLLAPPDTEPLHFTRFVVYTQSSLVEQTTPVGLNFVDKFSPVRNVSFWDYDLDETDLFGDLLWEAPEDDDVVLQYHIYMAENSTGKERSLLGIVPKGVHNFSIAAETPLVNYTHFLIYTASALAEQTTPVALLIFDAVASVSEIVFEDRDLDPLEIGGNVSWSAPLLDDRVELYRVYVANTATGVGRYQVGPDVVKPQLEMAIVPETPLPPQPYIVVYTQSALMEQTTPVWLAITDNFASVANITFPDFDLDAGDLGGEVSWDAPQDDRLVSSYNIYVAKSVLNDPSGQCNFEVAAPFVSVISGLITFAMTGSEELVAQIKAALSKSFGIPQSDIFVSVATQIPGQRRLQADDSDQTDFRIALSLSPGEASRVLAEMAGGVSVFDLKMEITDVAVETRAASVRTVRSDVTSTAATARVLAEDSDGSPSTNSSLAWCRRSYRQVTDLNITVPTETALEDFTHFVIYTASTLVEQSTPVEHLIFDATATVGGIGFIDDDLDPFEFGGNVTWQEPLDASRVQDYLLYFAEDAAGANRSSVGSIVPVGTNRILLAADIQQQAHDHLVIYTRSFLVEQTTPAFFALSDTHSIASDIVFEDLDLDYTDLGGNISWLFPVEAQQVTEYYIYLGDSPEPAKILGENGSFPWTGRSQLGVVPYYDSDLFVPSETPRNGYGYVLVYASSALAEQTTPAVHVIHDANASVSNVDFVGKDLDLEDLGGYVSWIEPTADLDRVMAYSVYLSLDAVGTGRSKIEQDVLVGSTQLLVPAETPRQTFTYFVVYTRSTLVEQSTPVSHVLFDTSALPRNLDFLDIDVDRNEMGGNLTWEAPSDPTHVVEYVIYLGENAYGKDRSLLGNVSESTFEFFVPLDTLIDNFTHLLVYSKSDLAEMTTPAALLIKDSVAEVDNITLFDRDLDKDEVGGEITWDPPTEERIVDKYRVFFQVDPAGSEKSQVDTDQPPGSLTVSFPEDTNITGMEYIGIFITAFGIEQQTPSVAPIVETISSVGFVAFTDKDLDNLQIGGTIYWGPPPEITYNQDYVVYYAQSATGDARLVAGVVPLGTNSLTIPLDTYHNQFTHFVVYTRSVAYEQTTPVGVEIYDHDGLVTNLYFSDTDLDLNMIGGVLQWTLPSDTSGVLQYNVYLTFTSNPWDPYFRRDALELALSPTLTQATVPVGTSKLSGDGIEEVTCSFTAADTIVSVFYNGSDISYSVNGTFSEWSSTKTLAFQKVPGAYLVITASSLLDQSWCSASENICIAGRFGQVLNYCSMAGFSIVCSDGTTAGSAGWEAYGSSSGVDSSHQAGLGTGWSTTCVSQSGFYLVSDSKTDKAWVSSGLQHAAFRLLSGALSPTRNETYTHFMVYAQSTLAEQTTPATLQMVDHVAYVDYLRFVDEDLGLASIGGELRWNALGDLTLASGYSIYVATDSSGSDRLLLGTSPVGTTSLTLPQGTALTGDLNYTHVVIYIESYLVQQRLPAWSLLLVDEYEGLCDSTVCGSSGGQPTSVGSCTTAASCANCDLTPTRLESITTTIQGPMVLITTEANTDIFGFWNKLSSCGVSTLDVQYYKALGPAAPATTTTQSYTCRFSCLPGADCNTCVSADTAPVTTSSVDDDGYSVWRYLACAFRGISGPTDADLTYSYVFSQGVYMGSAAEAMATGCEPYIMAVTSQPPFAVSNVNVGCVDLACHLS